MFKGKSFQLSPWLPPGGGGLLMKELIKLAHIKKCSSVVIHRNCSVYEGVWFMFASDLMWGKEDKNVFFMYNSPHRSQSWMSGVNRMGHMISIAATRLPLTELSIGLGRSRTLGMIQEKRDDKGQYIYVLSHPPFRSGAALLLHLLCSGSSLQALFCCNHEVLREAEWRTKLWVLLQPSRWCIHVTYIFTM